MKRLAFALPVGAALIFLAACSAGVGTDATLSLKLTDAPVATDAVKEVYVRFDSLAVNESTSAGIDGDGWIEVPIDPDREYELLSLSNGISAALGEVDIRGGIRINQIRFKIGAVELVESGDAEGDPRHPVTVPSGTLKIVNAFDVPLSGNLTVVADFDVRKSLILTAQGYKMKPVLRAVVENEAGEIHGDAPVGYIVFAYPSVEGADIDLGFVDDPNDADSAAFDDAYTSAVVRDDGRYTLAFLDAGSYDLVLVDPTDGSVAAVVNDVIVESAKGVEVDISLP